MSSKIEARPFSAALASNLAVWDTFCAFAMRKKVPTSPLSFVARPLTLALALRFCAQALALDPWVGACAALIIYVFSAPFLDRSLVSAAHSLFRNHSQDRREAEDSRFDP